MMIEPLWQAAAGGSTWRGTEEEAEQIMGPGCRILVFCRGCRRYLDDIPSIETSLRRTVTFTYA